MAEYDELYLLKNPFFLGTFDKAIKEQESLVIDETDIATLERKTFYLTRVYLSLGEWEKAEGVLAKHLGSVKCSEPEKEKFAKIIKILIEFVKSGKYDADFMRDEFERLQQDNAYRTNPRNLPLLILICYILYSIKEYDCIIPLIFDIKDVDIYGIKFLTYWQMKRYDYMQKCYEEIKQLSEDASLTQLMQCFMMLCTGNIKDLVQQLNEVMQKYDKSIKLYNFIGIAMLAKGQAEKAIKMYEKLVQDLDLKNAEKCKKYFGNADIVDMVHNYLLSLHWVDDESPQIAVAAKMLENVGGNDQSAALAEFEEGFQAACKKVFEETKAQQSMH